MIILNLRVSLSNSIIFATVAVVVCSLYPLKLFPHKLMKLNYLLNKLQISHFKRLSVAYIDEFILQIIRKLHAQCNVSLGKVDLILKRPHL